MLQKYCLIKDIDIIDHITIQHTKGKPIDKKEALRVLDLYPHTYYCVSNMDFSGLTENDADEKFADALVKLRTEMIKLL